MGTPALIRVLTALALRVMLPSSGASAPLPTGNVVEPVGLPSGLLSLPNSGGLMASMFGPSFPAPRISSF